MFEIQKEAEKEEGRGWSIFFNRTLKVGKNLSKTVSIDNGVFQEILSIGIRTQKREEKKMIFFYNFFYFSATFDVQYYTHFRKRDFQVGIDRI